MTDLSDGSIPSTDIFSEADFHEMVAIIRSTQDHKAITAALKEFLVPFLAKINANDGFNLTMDDFLDQVLQGIGKSYALAVAGSGHKALAVRIDEIFTPDDIQHGLTIINETEPDSGVPLLQEIVKPRLEKLEHDHPDKKFHGALEVVTMQFVNYLAELMNHPGQVVH